MNTGIVRSHYSNGNIEAEFPWVNGEFHGTEKLWYRDGNPWYEISWVNDKLHGVYKRWDCKGKLTKYYYFKGEKVSFVKYLILKWFS